MATSSFSRNFVIADDKEVDKLIHSLENPTKVVLEKSTDAGWRALRYIRA